MKRKYKLLDIVYIAMIIFPLVVAMGIKILTSPPTEGVSISGALVYFTIPMPIQDLPITEAQVNSFLIIVTIAGICLYLTNGIQDKTTKRHWIAEWIVEKVEGMVQSNMGERFMAFAPFICAILVLSALSSLSSLLGLFPPTSDLNIIAGWAILVFTFITYYKLKGGVGNYLKGYTEPIALFAPMNVISELATPVSMAFRHYGNVLSGVVISALVGTGLSGLTALALGWLPKALGEIPFLQIGIPAVLSLYFDVFSGCLQAFIFAMLTMLYISNGFPGEAYEKRMKRKAEKRKAKFAKANQS